MDYLYLKLAADDDNALESITNLIDEKLQTKMKFKFQLEIIVDEIFSNIAKHAYKNKGGLLIVEIIRTHKLVMITFKDEGPRFNPLDTDDPDVELGVEDRQIGGLGIFMVKRLVDMINYEFQDGRNVLRIIKTIPEDQRGEEEDDKEE